MSSNANGASESAILNSTDRKRIIKECCAEIATLEAQRRQIGEQIGEIKQKRIKGDLQMKIADFNAALRAYSLEGDDRNAYLDALREVLEAHGIGYQADWIEAAQQADAKQSEPPSEAVLNELRENGRTAGKMGRSADTNPHSVDTDEGAAWHDGWLKGQKALTDAQFGEPQTAA